MKTYTYDSANRLLQVSDQLSVTSLSYNGLGQRLSMDAAGVIATYVLDGNQPLTAESNGNTTFYLYGLGAIGEETNAWSYSLPDGTNTPRQLTNSLAEITLASRYTPWGDTLDTYGIGNFTFGYLGGVLDATTGLIYVSNGQYYDPSTGRFLTRDVNPDSTNPYVPWNPIGAILGPLGLIALVFGRRKKGSKTGTFLVLLIVLGGVGMTLAACAPAPTPPSGSANTTLPAMPAQTQTPVPTGPGTVSDFPTGTPTAPIETPTAIPCPTPWYTATPSDSSIARWLKDTFGVELLNSSENANEIWNEARTDNARRAIEDVADKLGRVTGKDRSTAFRDAFSTYSEYLVMKKVKSYSPYCTEGDSTEGGCTALAHLILFADIDYFRADSGRNNIVHELGHAFNKNYGRVPEDSLPSKYPTDRNLFLHNNKNPGVMWQASQATTPSETFADMFVAYTYDVWGDWSNPNNIKTLQDHNPNDPTAWNPPQWMEDHMKAWLN